MKKIKVCNIIPGLRSGGVESFLYNNFSKGNWENIELTIITHGKTYEEVQKKFERLGIKVYSVTSKNINIIKNLIEINKILRKEKFDIIHSHMSNNSCFPFFLALINGIKIRIMHIHEKPKKNLKFQITNKISAILSTNFCACSNESLQYCLGNNKNINKKSKIIYNCIDASKYTFDKKSRKTIRANLKIQENEYIIGLFGRFVQEKNHKFIINVIKDIEDKNIKLLLIGDGKLKQEVEKYIESKKISNRVKMLSFKENIEEYYSAIDLFVLPSLSEGFGIVAVEAQISGLKCLLSSNVPRETEIVKKSCTYLDLNAEIWKKEILKSKKKYEQKRIIKPSEYEQIDINQNRQEIQEYYKGLMC